MHELLLKSSWNIFPSFDRTRGDQIWHHSVFKISRGDRYLAITSFLFFQARHSQIILYFPFLYLLIIISMLMKFCSCNNFINVLRINIVSNLKWAKTSILVLEIFNFQSNLILLKFLHLYVYKSLVIEYYSKNLKCHCGYIFLIEINRWSRYYVDRNSLWILSTKAWKRTGIECIFFSEVPEFIICRIPIIPIFDVEASCQLRVRHQNN